MIEVALSKSFLRAYKKKIKNNSTFEELFDVKLQIFLNNPFDKSLKTHKLSGKLSDCWSFSLDFQTRVMFIFVEPNKVILENIGSHREVY
jgi:mRNA-degrading endonuclease YafQ of YafQ-DinJ toxin-antitoxin module